MEQPRSADKSQPGYELESNLAGFPAHKVVKRPGRRGRAQVSVSKYCRTATLEQRGRPRAAPNLSMVLVFLSRVGMNFD